MVRAKRSGKKVQARVVRVRQRGLDRNDVVKCSSPSAKMEEPCMGMMTKQTEH